MHFTKMNGLGNDYIFIDCTEKTVEFGPKQIVALCDRHFGIGGDGIVMITKSQSADFGMTIYNSDGSRAEMCGNALRCLAKFAYNNKLTREKYLKIETDGGMRFVKINSDGTVTANMRKPKSDFEPTIVRLDTSIQGYKVNTGNPHFVVFCTSFDEYFDEYAERLSNKTDVFPAKTNVEFVKVFPSDNKAVVRVYERGSGETLACGTGATAVFETAYKFGYLKDNATVVLKGGNLSLTHNSKGEVLVTGDAKFNYEGRTEILNDG